MTKLSAQISVLMARSGTSSMDDPLRRSYQKKGTFRTAMSIVANRGVAGLYSGFSLHLCEYHFYPYLVSYPLRLPCSCSERHDWHGHLFHNLRKRKTTARQVSRQFFAHFSFVCSHGWWPLRFSLVGLRKCSHLEGVNARDIQLTQ